VRILVIGSGLMGPAAAYNALSDPRVTQVLLCDAQPEQIDAARARLARLPGGDRLDTAVLDLSDQAAAVRTLAGFDAVLAALPRSAIPLGIQAAVAAGVPYVDLSWPPDDQVPALQQRVESSGSLVIPGCGLEPGLTEIMARFLAEKLDRVDELHIKCGGIPAVPSGPLGYKIVFGGRQLPLREQEARLVDDGALMPVPRYSDTEPAVFDGVGEVEAWHEGFMPWLLDLEPLKALKRGTQKTVRWPGYAARATLLKELGLLSQEPVDVGAARVAPKQLLDAVLYPRVRMEDGERDIVVLRVEASGQKDGLPRRYQVEMVDRFDEGLGFTAMARTTAFTGAIVARMAARGEIGARGWLTPEKVITGPLLSRLVSELRELGITFSVKTESVELL